jgi:hypothetical protein
VLFGTLLVPLSATVLESIAVPLVGDVIVTLGDVEHELPPPPPVPPLPPLPPQAVPPPLPGL